MIDHFNPPNPSSALLQVFAILLLFALAGCNKPVPPGNAQDSSAASQSSATTPGTPSSSDKSSEDLAKIRAIKEQEEARAKASNQSTQEYADGVRKGAAAPIREIK
jgi:hypothetical protein